MLTDSLIDANWLDHVGGTAGIGGVAPTAYGWERIPGQRRDILISMSGTADPKGYPAYMIYTTRPIYSTLGCTFKYDLVLGPESETACNVNESDCMFAMKCSDGQTRLFNGSVQRSKTQGWMVVNAQGQWMPIGFNPPIFIGPRNTIEIEYQYSLTLNSISVQSITVNGEVGDVPTAMQDMPAQVTTWAQGMVNVQIQLGGLPGGAAWSQKISPPELVWK